MTQLNALVRRNGKLFFKDKGMFFTSLITPLILLVLYAAFLAKVYRESFASAMPPGFSVDGALIDAMAGGELVSSLLAVCCVTVSFCANLLMVQDKVTGARRDLTMSPVKSSTLALSYFLATMAVTLLICYVAMAACLAYLAVVGWYLSAADVLLLALDVLILVLFGTAVSSLVNCNLCTNGQASAVGTVVSSCYGFISGAYMPISSFGTGLQRVIGFLPGTYGTSLLRNHALGGVFAQMEKEGLPATLIGELKDSVDCNLYFFGRSVPVPVMYLIIVGAGAAFTVGYVVLCRHRREDN